MSIYDVNDCDAAMILEGLADVLELLPPADEPWDVQERTDVAAAARAGAALIAQQIDARGEQSYAAARGYGGMEWRNAVLRAFLGIDGAARVLGVD
ncbi:hypothetical protein [Arsenicicoccus dermatophilus]|uniref:hypothetical protein n=1 Tax=Arsenicicoccus dermatophilus TaxID=1076331 RepID=UPI0039170541